MLFAPGPTVITSRSAEMLALPLASARSIGRSPAWRSALVGWPCGLPCGLKWPLALMPSPELQSPASWMWKPTWLLGCRPDTVPLTRTRSAPCTKVTVPLTLLPLVGCSTAVAFSPLEVRFDQVSCTVWQPASKASVAADAMTIFIGLPDPLFLRRLGRRLGRSHRDAL